MLRKRHLFLVLAFWVTAVLIAGCADRPSEPSAPGGDVLTYGDNVHFDETHPEITIRSEDTDTVISSKEQFPSKPAISPDGKKLIYIAPFEFELQGEIWLYEWPEQRHTKMLPSDNFPDGKSPNRVLWLDDVHLLISIGNTYGTIPSTQQLLVYSLESGKLEEKYAIDGSRHISGITVNEGEVRLTVETYDEQFLEVKDTSSFDVSIQELLN